MDKDSMQSKRVYHDDQMPEDYSRDEEKQKKIKKIQNILIIICFVLVIVIVITVMAGKKPYPVDETTVSSISEQNQAASTVVIPNFLDFAEGYTTKERDEINDNSDLRWIYYTLDSENGDELVKEYIDLLETEYSFKQIHVGKETNWYSFKYDGAKDIGGFELTFNNGEREYDGINLSLFVFNKDKKQLQCCISKNTDIVSTSKRASLKKQSDTVIPDFLQFANGHATQSDYEHRENEKLKYIYYKLDSDACGAIIKEYVDLIDSEYSYDLLNEDDKHNYYGLKFTGNAEVGMFFTEFSSGEKYNDDSVAVWSYYEDGSLIVRITISEVIDIVNTEKKTSYDKASSTVVPNFEDFANGYARQYKTVDNDGEGFRTHYFELDSEEYDYIVDEYVKLLTKDYSFEQAYELNNGSWKGFKYKGTEKLKTFNTTFKSSETKYEGLSLTLSVVKDEGKHAVKMVISKELDIINTAKDVVAK